MTGNSQPRVFIVDDDVAFGRSLQRVLRSEGLTADYYPSAREFLDSGAGSCNSGLAVIDICMPECDGFTLMAKMKERRWTLPVIAITGEAGPSAEESALRRGAVGFLQKPFEVGSLLSLAEHHFGGADG